MPLVEACVILGGEFHEAGPGVAGFDQAVDVDGVADFRAAEQCAGLAGGQVVGMQDRSEVGVDGRVVEELSDQFDFRPRAGGRVGDGQARIGLDLLRHVDAVTGGLVRGGDACGGFGHLLAGACDGGEKVHVLADALHDVVGLDGIAAGEGVSVVVRECVQGDADEAVVLFVHYAAAAAEPSAGKRASQAVRASTGRNRWGHRRRSVGPWR